MTLKLLLANAPNPTANRNASNYACHPHIGIVQLATATRDALGDRVEIRVVDGGISNTAAVQRAVRDFAPDLAGISALTPTYSEALEIASTAKACGAQVVLGDDHAIFFPEMILRNRPQTDYVIANDGGEIPFVQLVQALADGSGVSRVSSLAYRDGGRIRLNPAPKYALSLRNTIPDLSFIEAVLGTYADNYRAQFGHLHGHEVRPVTVDNARAGPRADQAQQRRQAAPAGRGPREHRPGRRRPGKCWRRSGRTGRPVRPTSRRAACSTRRASRCTPRTSPARRASGRRPWTARSTESRRCSARWSCHPSSSPGSFRCRTVRRGTSSSTTSARTSSGTAATSTPASPVWESPSPARSVRRCRTGSGSGTCSTSTSWALIGRTTSHTSARITPCSGSRRSTRW
nr:cobalamin-dependent protein [Streptomyces sp. 2P-4]